MTKIPITSGKLTGDVLEAFHRKYLDGSDLAAWAEALLMEGFDSDAITEAVGNPDMHWQRVSPLFAQMVRDVGLSQNVEADIATLKQSVMIEEFRRGYRRAAELLHRFDALRKHVGFPEPIEFRLLEDNGDGTNDSGYYAMYSRTSGPELENLIREHFKDAGILA